MSQTSGHPDGGSGITGMQGIPVIPAQPVPDGDVAAFRAEGVSKSFGGRRVLDGADLTIRAGEVRALVGANGSGKSTLIKILSGYHTPDSGSKVWIAGEPLAFGDPKASYRLGCRFIHQDLGLIEAMSVRDNISLGGGGYLTSFGTVNDRAARERARRGLALLGLEAEPDQLVSSLSPAIKTGIAVARVLDSETGGQPNLVVLDEPTANLHSSEAERLLAIVRRLSSLGVAVLYVSHRLAEVFEIADSVTVLRDGRHVATSATTDLGRGELVHQMLGRVLNVDDALRGQRHTQESRVPIVEAKNLSGRQLDDVSLSVAPGEVVGIAGITGSGRDTLLGSMFGATRPAEGVVEIDGMAQRRPSPRRSIRSGMVFVPADRKTMGLTIGQTARENVTLPRLRDFWRHGLLQRRREREHARSWMERLGVQPPQTELIVASFSGGNQQKILFARWFRLAPRILLVDEPTQGVDVGAKAQIHRELVDLAASGSAVVVSSSDVDELEAICQRVIVMDDGAVRLEVVGDELVPGSVNRAMHQMEEG